MLWYDTLFITTVYLNGYGKIQFGKLSNPKEKSNYIYTVKEINDQFVTLHRKDAAVISDPDFTPEVVISVQDQTKKDDFSALVTAIQKEQQEQLAHQPQEHEAGEQLAEKKKDSASPNADTKPHVRGISDEELTQSLTAFYNGKKTSEQITTIVKEQKNQLLNLHTVLQTKYKTSIFNKDKNDLLSLKSPANIVKDKAAADKAAAATEPALASAAAATDAMVPPAPALSMKVKKPDGKNERKRSIDAASANEEAGTGGDGKSPAMEADGSGTGTGCKSSNKFERPRSQSLSAKLLPRGDPLLSQTSVRKIHRDRRNSETDVMKNTLNPNRKYNTIEIRDSMFFNGVYMINKQISMDNSHTVYDHTDGSWELSWNYSEQKWLVYNTSGERIKYGYTNEGITPTQPKWFEKNAENRDFTQNSKICMLFDTVSDGVADGSAGADDASKRRSSDVRSSKSSFSSMDGSEFDDAIAIFDKHNQAQFQFLNGLSSVVSSKIAEFISSLGNISDGEDDEVTMEDLKKFLKLVGLKTTVDNLETVKYEETLHNTLNNIFDEFVHTPLIQMYNMIIDEYTNKDLPTVSAQLNLNIRLRDGAPQYFTDNDQKDLERLQKQHDSIQSNIGYLTNERDNISRLKQNYLLAIKDISSTFGGTRSKTRSKTRSSTRNLIHRKGGVGRAFLGRMMAFLTGSGTTPATPAPAPATPTPEERDAALRLQSKFRGYRIRKIQREADKIKRDGLKLTNTKITINDISTIGTLHFKWTDDAKNGYIFVPDSAQISPESVFHNLQKDECIVFQNGNILKPDKNSIKLIGVSVEIHKYNLAGTIQFQKLLFESTNVNIDLSTSSQKDVLHTHLKYIESTSVASTSASAASAASAATSAASAASVATSAASAASVATSAASSLLAVKYTLHDVQLLQLIKTASTLNMEKFLVFKAGRKKWRTTIRRNGGKRRTRTKSTCRTNSTPRRTTTPSASTRRRTLRRRTTPTTTRRRPTSLLRRPTRK
jgi:hypothetical protein